MTPIKKIWLFITENLWQIRVGKIDKKQGFLIKQLRIFSLAVKDFNEDNCLTKATALTYYSLFSIVPILAVLFALAKGFGFEKTLQVQILANYPQYTDILSNAFLYADKMLANTKGGVLAGIGVIILLWTVMKLLMSVENYFNEIWEISKGRTWVRKITDYLAILVVSPILLVLAGSVTLAIQTKLGNFEMISGFSAILYKLLAWGLLTLVFTLLYLILPNTKVNFKSAFVAGIITMILFQSIEWAYIKFQIGASSMNAIYGGFAALPLFLIWVQYSWYAVLFGAEIAFANQNVDRYELENEITKISVRYKKAISLLICNYVAKRFYNGEEPQSAQEIAEKLDMPIRLARTTINDLVETGIFNEVKDESEQIIRYQPGITESKLTVKNVINILDEKGINSLPIGDVEEFKTIENLMQEFSELLDNDLGNKAIKDIA
ncbi:MAG: YihY/virulence factor BrkB family protein [Bacteroidia bacterium]